MSPAPSTAGSSNASRPSRSPPVHASMNRSLTSRCSAESTGNRPTADSACRVRRARLASCRHAAGLRPTIVGDVVEGVLEHVVEHERRPLRRAQPFEQGMHGQGDVVDERDLTRRIDVRAGRRDRRRRRARRSGAAAASAAGRGTAWWSRRPASPRDRRCRSMSMRARRVNASCTDVLGVAEIQQDAKGEIEHAPPVRVPQRGERRIVGSGAVMGAPSCAVQRVTPSCGCLPARSASASTAWRSASPPRSSSGRTCRRRLGAAGNRPGRSGR